MTLSFTEKVQRITLKIEEPSKTKSKGVLKKSGLNRNIYRRDTKFTENCGILTLHPIKGKQGVLEINNY